MESRNILTILFISIFIIMLSAAFYHTHNDAYNEGYDKGYEDGQGNDKESVYEDVYAAGVQDGYLQAESDYTKIIEAQGEDLCEYEDISYCVVFVGNDRMYHHFTCNKLGEDFWENFENTAYDINHAKQCGYIPCPDCIG